MGLGTLHPTKTDPIARINQDDHRHRIHSEMICCAVITRWELSIAVKWLWLEYFHIHGNSSSRRVLINALQRRDAANACIQGHALSKCQ